MPVPRVLWKLFENKTNKARTLADTVVSLIPPPPSTAADCRCRGIRRPCIRCSGPDILLSPEDPPDYQCLLTTCYVVVCDDAPPLPEFVPYSNRSQRQVVAHAIEKLKRYSHVHYPEVRNAIFVGYDKYSRSSTILELLTSSAWCTLLTRVGETVMIHLLMHTCIFLPHQKKIYLQVAGSPINDLCKVKFLEFKSIAKEGCPPPKERKRTGAFNSQSHTKRMRPSLEEDSYTAPLRMVSTDKENGRSQTDLCASCNCHHIKVEHWLRDPRTRLTYIRRSLQFHKHIQLNLRGMQQQAAFPLHWSIPIFFFLDKATVMVEEEDPWPRLRVPQDYCVQLMTPQVVDEQSQVDKKFMFYNQEHSPSVFPRKHDLNSIKPSCADSDSLLKKCFGLSIVTVFDRSDPCSCSNHFSFTGSSCLYTAFAKRLRSLIHRTKRCQHQRLLNKHCPIPDRTCMFEESKSEAYRSDTSLHRAIKSYSPKRQVVSFIWAVCRSIIPPALLGTPYNWRILRRNISKFIRLRRFEIFYLKQCMHKLDSSRFFNGEEQKPGAEQGVVMFGGCSKSSNAVYSMKHKLVENWILWLFSSVVVPLVQAHFYVTESQHGRHDVYYYRMDVWKKLTEEAFTRLEDKNYKKLANKRVREIILCRKFGFSKMRLLPKENDVRVLANLTAPSIMPREVDGGVTNIIHNRSFGSSEMRQRPHYIPSVNGHLRGIHAILKDLKLKNPHMLGSSVFDYNDVHRQLCPFVLGLKNGLGKVPDVFIVTCDVSKAFDSIKQGKLLSVMEELILEGEYNLKQSHQVICTKKCRWVRKNTGLTRFTTSSAFSNSSHCVIIDDEEVNLTKEDLLSTLLDHLTQNILKLGEQFYMQGVGIPQGSILSPLLCSLYFGHLERNVVYPFLENARDSVSEDLHTGALSHAQNSSKDRMPCYKLLRFVDDFLFISTSKELASRFVSRFQQGFRNYNCYMNERKFSLNFDDGPPSTQVFEDGESFICWSGLLINCRTLEVQVDYTRYLKNHLRSTLTVRWGDKPGGYLMKKKLSGFLAPKCHPIFYDSNINSAATVRLNLYQAFLMSAMKTTCYMRQISYICEVDTQFFLKIIEKSLRYVQRRIRNMGSMNLGPNLRPQVQVKEEEVEWLALKAYLKALTRKQTRYRELLSLLKSRLSAHRITGTVSGALTYAVDDSHSSVMWKIKY